MRITDIDWRSVLNDWSSDDLQYLKSIIEEKLRTRPPRRKLICKTEG